MVEQASVVLDGVTYAYGTRQVLDGLDLRIDQGVTGLLGPNGAGKSTLLNLMATVAYPLKGGIAVAGEPLTNERQRDRARRRLGFLPQRFDAFPNFSALEVVEYVARLRGVSGRNARSLSRDALRLVGLEDRANSRFRALSGGQQRRVGIAQAIVQEPAVLILDEPTVGLDPGQRLAFRALVRGLGERSAVLLSTHLTEDVAATCSRVVVLDGGRIRFDGPPADLSHLGGPETQDDAETAMERGYQAVLSDSRIDSGMMATSGADWR